MNEECELDGGHYDRSAPGRHDYLSERTDTREVHVLHAGQIYELPLMWFWEKQIHPYQAVPVMLSRQGGSYPGCCERTRCATLSGKRGQLYSMRGLAAAFSPDKQQQSDSISLIAGKQSQRQWLPRGLTQAMWPVA